MSALPEMQFAAAVTGGAMVPLLTLGIPGDTVTAVLIGALLIQGIERGQGAASIGSRLPVPL